MWATSLLLYANAGDLNKSIMAIESIRQIEKVNCLCQPLFSGTFLSFSFNWGLLLNHPVEHNMKTTTSIACLGGGTRLVIHKFRFVWVSNAKLMGVNFRFSVDILIKRWC